MKHFGKKALRHEFFANVLKQIESKIKDGRLNLKFGFDPQEALDLNHTVNHQDDGMTSDFEINASNCGTKHHKSDDVRMISIDFGAPDVLRGQPQ